MADAFKNYAEGLESPPSHLALATPNDSTDLPDASRSLNVATSGDVRVTTITGDTVTLYVAAGITFPVRVRRIWATGTTATAIVVMY